MERIHIIPHCYGAFIDYRPYVKDILNFRSQIVFRYRFWDSDTSYDVRNGWKCVGFYNSIEFRGRHVLAVTISNKLNSLITLCRFLFLDIPSCLC